MLVRCACTAGAHVPVASTDGRYWHARVVPSAPIAGALCDGAMGCHRVVYVIPGSCRWHRLSVPYVTVPWGGNACFDCSHARPIATVFE